jgi:hypothetical protein
MTTKHDISAHRNMQAPLAEFTVIAADMVVRLGLEKSGGRGPKGESASERVIRDYVRRGVLSPTLADPSSGARALYGYRHLLEFLAARVLLNDSWTLDRIADRLKLASDEELEQLLPGSAEANPALAAARALRSETGRELVPYMSVDRMAGGLERAAKRRAELPMMMAQLSGPGHDIEASRTVTFRLGPEVTVTINARHAQKLTIDEAERLGRALTGALVDLPRILQLKERTR